jgi:DNA-nicking Smr family endonuclease
LTAEDEALWRAVAETVAPLDKRTPPRPEPMEGQLLRRSGKDQSAAEDHPTTTKSASKVAPSASRRAAVTSPRPPPTPVFEVKRARRLRRGVLAIEDRIDLHGMRQAEARRALRSFLLSAHARGLRHVKIITGKGRADVLHDRPFDLHSSERPGVLKRLVPAWLAEPDLAAVVVSFTSAGRQHGGEGALYVHLRRA